MLRTELPDRFMDLFEGCDVEGPGGPAQVQFREQVGLHSAYVLIHGSWVTYDDGDLITVPMDRIEEITWDLPQLDSSTSHTSSTVQVRVEDGAVDPSKIRVIARDEAKKELRAAARRATTRGLPSQNAFQ